MKLYLYSHLWFSEHIKDDNSSMDWVEHMKFFYNSDYENNDVVINGWYNYVLPTVSKEWKDKISSNKVKDKSLIFQYVMISDEALVHWLVELWLPTLKILVDITGSKMIRKKVMVHTIQNNLRGCILLFIAR